MDRKPNRLKGYDYSVGGAYHITICTAERKNLFRKNGKLTEFGKIAEEKIKETAEKYKIKIEYFNVLKNSIGFPPLRTAYCRMGAPGFRSLCHQLSLSRNRIVTFKLFRASFFFQHHCLRISKLKLLIKTPQ